MSTSTTMSATDRATTLRQRLDALRTELDQREESIAGIENALARAKVDGSPGDRLQNRLQRLEGQQRTTSAAIALCERELEEVETLEREESLAAARQQVEKARGDYLQAITAEHEFLQRMAADLEPLRRRSERALQAAVNARHRAYHAGAAEYEDARDVLTYQETPEWARGGGAEVVMKLRRLLHALLGSSDPAS